MHKKKRRCGGKKSFRIRVRQLCKALVARNRPLVQKRNDNYCSLGLHIMSTVYNTSRSPMFHDGPLFQSFQKNHSVCSVSAGFEAARAAGDSQQEVQAGLLWGAFQGFLSRLGSSRGSGSSLLAAPWSQNIFLVVSLFIIITHMIMIMTMMITIIIS